MPAPKKSLRPKVRPADLAAGAAVSRGNRIKEMERDEEDMMKKAKGGKVKKMAAGGMARGCGAATKGKRYSRSA